METRDSSVGSSESESVTSAHEEYSSAAVGITPIPIDDMEVPPAPPVAPVPPPPPRRSRPRPTRAVGRYLFGTEKYVGEWRRHWIHIVGWSALGIISPFVVGYLIGILGQSNSVAMWLILAGWVLLLGLVAWMIASWWLERFVLTNKRVMLVGGIITRRVGMMPLARVTDMAYVQSPLGMALNYGTFILESAGQDQAFREIKPLPHPNELYLLFCQEMYDPGSVEPEAEENAPEGDYEG